MNKLYLFLLLTFFIASNIPAQEMSHEMNSPVPFEEASVRFEQNATDGDVEVVFEIKGGDEGLTSLDIISPSGKSIGNFSAPEASDMGIRQFKFESPEPSDIDALKDAYPEGIYKITAISTIGVEFHSEVILNHELPGVTSFINPEAEAEDVDYENLIIQWAPVDNVDGYFIELDQEDSGINLQITLPGSFNMFALPQELLKPDTEYVLGIGTISEEGNISVIETSFSTKRNK